MEFPPFFNHVVKSRTCTKAMLNHILPVGWWDCFCKYHQFELYDEVRDELASVSTDCTGESGD